MERAGEKLKRARERLNLTFRDVERASQQIAIRRGSEEFCLAKSRLADVENKGTVPSIFRIYTLCAIYRLDFDEVLRWYAVPREHLAGDAMHLGISATHMFHLPLDPSHSHPISDAPEEEIDVSRTTFLSHLMRRWGKLPIALLNSAECRRQRYAYIGLDDWSMHPILHPGSLIAIDESRRRIADSGWTTELDRPIYFLETREGFLCGWCSLDHGRLVVQFHPSSQQKPRIFDHQNGVDILGQVCGVAMILESRKRSRVQSAAVPAGSLSR
ncbi:MAG TPA: helix-turn-helix transcriptional regulator [Candidatus Limnocylindrales bacterium]|nr:helix-turn-helix transcriptional regulator [Candidatus Limnocylindrales bacterium]